jgi:hypothetical protein
MARWVLWASIVITAVVTMGAQPDLRSMLVLTLAALATALIASTLAVPTPSGRVMSLRDRRETPVAPRQCDPDAPGRARPRAPSSL